MRKFLLFLLIFCPFSSLYAENCEIELHTGALQRTGNFVFPKGTLIQNFEVDNGKMLGNYIYADNATYLSVLEKKYGHKWTQAINSQMIQVIDYNVEGRTFFDFVKTWYRFSLTLPITQKNRTVEFYPIDFHNLYWYSYPGYADSLGEVNTIPKVFLFSPSRLPLESKNLGVLRFKICTIDQQKLAHLLGFSLQSSGKSLVLVPYYTFQIPQDNSLLFITPYTLSNDTYVEYSQMQIRNGKPVLPIEYK